MKITFPVFNNNSIYFFCGKKGLEQYKKMIVMNGYDQHIDNDDDLGCCIGRYLWVKTYKRSSIIHEVCHVVSNLTFYLGIQDTEVGDYLTEYIIETILTKYKGAKK